MKRLEGIAGEVLAIYRGEEADPNLLYRAMPHQQKRKTPND